MDSIASESGGESAHGRQELSQRGEQHYSDQSFPGEKQRGRQAEKRRSPRHHQAFPPPAPNILFRHVDLHKTEDERYPVQKRLGHEAERQIEIPPLRPPSARNADEGQEAEAERAR